MLKKIIFQGLMLITLCISAVAQASDATTLAQVYHELKTTYIKNLAVEKFAISTLQQLSSIDPKLMIANDGRRLSMYYDAKVVRSYKKPEYESDVKAWAKISARIIKDSIKQSPILKENDFRLLDKLLQNSVANLGNNSKYYPSLEIEEVDNGSKIHFAVRQMNDILYLKIGDFNHYTANKVKNAVTSQPDLNGLIVDIRGNNGGNLVEALNVADLFLDDGLLLATRDRNKDITYYNATKNDIIGGRSMVIIVDGETASAAEAFAASLQEQGRALVLGTTTFGKGTVQSLVNLDNDSVLALTTAEFFTPGDVKIDGIGVSPNICVTENCLPESRAEREKDITTAVKTLSRN